MLSNVVKTYANAIVLHIAKLSVPIPQTGIPQSAIDGIIKSAAPAAISMNNLFIFAITAFYTAA